MSINFFKLYAIRMIFTIVIFFVLLFIGQQFIPNINKYAVMLIIISLLLSPRIKHVELQSGKEMRLVWFGKLLAKLPK